MVLENTKVTAMYQVCYDLSDQETLTREVRGLIRAAASLDCLNLNLITLNPDMSGLVPKEITVLTPDKVLG